MSKRIARLKVDQTLLVREHDRLYPQGALPNLTHPGIHYNLLDDRNIHQHILSHVANLQEVQATVTRCPLNLENGTWWKNVKCLTFKDVILLNNIYCGSNSFEEGAMAVESELECLSVSSVHDITRRLGGTDPTL